ncbi:MAG: hypothetical protein ABSD10_01820 [Candidatus Saccharimonadales bacterium]|jgi:uncharacterized membrane protein
MSLNQEAFRRREMVYAQTALLIAIALGLSLDKSLVVGPKYIIAVLELFLVFGIGITAPLKHSLGAILRRNFSLLLIALISLANGASMILVANDLIKGSSIQGRQLIFAAFAIFVTNIIIFSLWYWEIDSPGLTGIRKHDDDPKFQFPQMAINIPETKDWEPSYFDYLYLSTTNASAFSPTDALPMTHGAKLLMGLQAFISLLTVVLVTARAVNILG